MPLTVSLLLALGIAIYAMATPANDLAGTLPTEAAAEVPPDHGGMPAGDWRAYGRTAFGDRWSPLDRITPANVDQLQVAWTYHTGDVRGPGDPLETTYEVTVLKVDDTIYLCTPHNHAIALDAATGEERSSSTPSPRRSACRARRRPGAMWPAPTCAPGRSPGCTGTERCATARRCRCRSGWACRMSAGRS